MTEPIKLPLRDAIIEGMGWRDIKSYIAKDDDLICRIERVVEQAAADLRERLAKAEADSNVWAERYRKAALKRDEARAELARLTELLSDVRAVEAELAEKSDEIARLTTLLARYRNETPLGHQPHMIAHEADAVLDAAFRRSVKVVAKGAPLPDVKEAK
jgi:hypothetical protein